ncbi:MAG TPA: glycosyltransferase family 39 protein [Chthoniobacterales bacterium]
MLKSLLPYVLLFLVWAGMYVPGLGVLEIRGEEGRRVLPALSMLDGGNWFVPHIGDVPYLKKPPLVNWLVAASFAATGRRNEWAARLPSALGVLALALGMFVATRRWLGPDHARFAALAVLTTVEMVDKGRLIEIDALYTAAFGLALVAWIDGADRSPWRRWVVPGIFLGLGLLLKGPLLLLFFYAIVLPTLARQKALAQLWSAPHVAGLLVMAVIFGAWLVPHLASPETKQAVGVWSGQYAERLDWGDYHPVHTLGNVGRALINFLPWVLLVLLGRTWAGNDPPLVRGLELGTLVTFVLVMLVPGGLPRYTLPLAVTVGLLAARRLHDQPRLVPVIHRAVFFFSFVPLLASFSVLFWPEGRTYVIPAGMIVLMAMIWTHFENTPGIKTLNWTLGALGVAAVLFFCGKIQPELRRRESLRPEAGRIDRLTRPGQTIFAAGLATPHLLFYVRAPHRYVDGVGAIPETAEYVLTGSARVPDIQKRFGDRATQLLDYHERGGNETFLFEVRN